MKKDLAYFLKEKTSNFKFTDGISLEAFGQYLIYKFLSDSDIGQLFEIEATHNIIGDELLFWIKISSKVFKPQESPCQETRPEEKRTSLVFQACPEDEEFAIIYKNTTGNGSRIFFINKNQLALNPYQVIEVIISLLKTLHETSKALICENKDICDDKVLETFCPNNLIGPPDSSGAAIGFSNFFY